jgi:alanine-glyoxylate transaminase / serine-glyoxylate transaminase / serine-pyruvate transaminase
MSVRAGREFLAIPGPTTMPDQVLQAMHRPALDIYSNQMVDLTDSLIRDLSKLFATRGKSYIYISNGHGAWEAVLSNVLSRGDKVLVLESGRFAINWGNAAHAMGAEVEVLKGDWRRAVQPEAVEAHLRKDTNHEIKAILVCAGRHGFRRDQRRRGDRQGGEGVRPSRLVHGRCGRLAWLHAV